MNRRKLVVTIASLAIGTIGIGTGVQANRDMGSAKSIESHVLLANHSSSVYNYVQSSSNRERAWNTAVRLHNGDRKNNCTFYVSSLLRGAGYNVPNHIGYTSYLGDWLGNNGWTRKTNLNELKAGDIAFAGNTHAVVFLSWVNKDKKIARVNDEQAASYNNEKSYERFLNGARHAYTPGDKKAGSYRGITYFMTPNSRDVNHNSEKNVSGKTTIQSSIGWLHFRTGSSTNYRVIASIPTGTTVNVLAQSNGWYKISYNGQEGWVSGNYTTGIQSGSADNSHKDTTDKGGQAVSGQSKTTVQSSIGWLHFRTGSSTNYKIIASIPTGTTLNVLAQSNGWYKVSYNGQEGWIAGNYTTGIQNGTATKEDTDKNVVSKSKTTIQSSIGWLRFRTGNSTSYRVISKIPTGTTVDVLGQNNGWYKIQYHGQIGWISGNYTTGL